MDDKICVYVAAHKPAEIMWDEKDKGFKFIHVGAKKSSCVIENSIRDDTGNNISELNPLYCELTGLYWIWKNDLEHDFVGLCHYRRFLSRHEYALNSKKNIYSSEELEDMLKEADIIVPKKEKKNSRNSLYATVAELNDDPSYSVLKKAIGKIYPEYLQELEDVFMDKEMFFGNIMLCRKCIFDDYTKWLFDILEQVKIEIEIDRKTIAPRQMGFLSEWLLNVWVLHHKDLRVKYLPVHRTEKENNVKYICKCALERVGYVR